MKTLIAVALVALSLGSATVANASALDVAKSVYGSSNTH